MGGDHAPAEVVRGTVNAVRRGGLHVTLVGDPGPVEAELSLHDLSGLSIDVAPSQGVIVDGESPAVAIRRKPRASVLVSTGLVRDGMADGCVTMGSTGAAMAAGAVLLGLIEGMERPALGGPIVGLAPRTVIVDLGTGVDCKPAQMVGFAMIGDVFARQFWGVERPRIALLSVGAEAGKGNRQTRETAELLAESGLNFVGNVEADELPAGAVDVAVCDGFVGNVVMKLTEGLGRGVSEHLRKRLRGRLPDAEVEEIVREVYDLGNVVEALGGGPMFGINGVSVVGHGRARAGAVERAIGMARHAVESGFVAKLNEELPRVIGVARERPLDPDGAVARSG